MIAVDVRCETCLGMGYKGRTVRGKWKLLTCRVCGGRGCVPETQKQRPRKPKKG